MVVVSESEFTYKMCCVCLGFSFVHKVGDRAKLQTLLKETFLIRAECVFGEIVNSFCLVGRWDVRAYEASLSFFSSLGGSLRVLGTTARS